MTHVALALTLALLAVTGYLAWEGQLAAKGARKELEFVKKNQATNEMARPSGKSMVSLPTAPATASITPPPLTASGVPAGTEVMAGSAALPGGGLTVPKSVIAAEASGVSTNTLTGLQKQVLAAKPVAKVKTVVKDQGFIVLDSGSKQQITKGMKLDIRRDSAVLGKVTVTDAVEETEAVADMDLASIPAGVSIEPGDELIQPVGR
ncbi:MAG: hypothetical protein U0984_13195 [Prosthecobacter sp.]|nr:hypothetical protein [Prosthecobacter sp.]